jgi:type IV secretion system protein VirD4
MNKHEQHSLLLALGAVGLGLALVWLTGAAGAAIFGEGWTPIPAAEVPAAAVRLLFHLGDPRSAWPPDARNALPGALGFYLTGCSVLAGIFAAVVLAYRAAERLGMADQLGGESRRAPAARWANGRDLRALRVRSAQPGRLTLGHSGRSLIAAEERGSVIAFAPTQSYKTTGLAIPAMLEWQGPVLATSVKSDLLRDTLSRREELGEVMIFDPTQVTGFPTSRATPLWGAHSWRGALRVAGWLSSGARIGSGGGLQDADFWFATAQKLLAPLLFAAAANGRTMEAVVRWLDEGPEASENEVLDLLDTAGVPAARRAYLATQNREDRQRSSVYTTAEMAVAAFADPTVIEETSASDYSPAWLLNGAANTLYICAPSEEQERLRPVFSMMLQEVWSVIDEAEAATGHPLDPSILFLLDEAANVAPLPNADKIASTGAGKGVQQLSIYQDLAQLKARHGRLASSIVNNYVAKYIGAGTSDRDTLEYGAAIIGPGEFEQRSRTAGERGRQSTTEGDTYRDLVPPNVLRSGELGTGVLVHGNLPPTRLQLRPWFRDSRLKELRDRAPSGSDVQEV